MDIELSSLNALRSLPHIGDKSLRLLVGHFGSGWSAWEYTGSFEEVVGLSAKAKTSLMTRTLSQRESLWAELESQSIQILHTDNPLYPRLLLEIPDHPLILYVRGDFDWTILNHRPVVAIVGSRRFTPYGEQVALRLSYDLAQAGFIVISGLAFGIDKQAHLGTIDAKGQTLAVLGGGITDRDIAPRSHLTLAKNILTNGALISEYPPHTEIRAGNFPTRNRIVAGLAHGVIVIEAAVKSGSLITAHLALEYNREVFAVPGSIFSPVSHGTHTLIKRGAKVVTCAQDVIEELAPQLTVVTSEKSGSPGPILNDAEKLIFQYLSHEPQEIHLLVKQTALAIAELQSAITLLELKGLIKNIPGLGYQKIY